MTVCFRAKQFWPNSPPVDAVELPVFIFLDTFQLLSAFVINWIELGVVLLRAAIHGNILRLIHTLDRFDVLSIELCVTAINQVLARVITFDGESYHETVVFRGNNVVHRVGLLPQISIHRWVPLLQHGRQFFQRKEQANVQY